MCAHKYDLYNNKHNFLSHMSHKYSMFTTNTTREVTNMSYYVTHVHHYGHNKHNEKIMSHYVTHVTQIHLHGHNKHSFLSHYVKYNLSPLKSSWDIINIAHSWREVNICQIRQEQHMSVPVLYVALCGNLRCFPPLLEAYLIYLLDYKALQSWWGHLPKTQHSSCHSFQQISR